MSAKERPSVAMKALVSAKNTVRIMRTAPLPKTKKIEKQPIPGKAKKIAGQPKVAKAVAKKVVAVKKHNLRKTVANSRELKMLLTNNSMPAKKPTSGSKKSSGKRNQSKKVVINSPRVAPVKKSLLKKKSLPKSVKKVNASKPKANPPEMDKVVIFPKSKSKPKVVKPINAEDPTDNGKVIKVLKVNKPTTDSTKKSVTFVLQKKERKPSRYFELLAQKPKQ